MRKTKHAIAGFASLLCVLAMALSVIGITPDAAWAADGAPAVTYTVKIDGKTYATDYVAGRHIDVTKDSDFKAIIKDHNVSASNVHKVLSVKDSKFIKVYSNGTEFALNGAGSSTMNIQCSPFGAPTAFDLTDIKVEARQNVLAAATASTQSVSFKAADDEPATTTEVWKITYDANGGEGSIDAQEVPKGEKATLTKVEDKITKAGYTFKNWQDEDGNEYEDGQADVEITKDLTLTAQWEPINYTVKFNSNGEGEEVKGTMADETFAYDEEKALTTNTYERHGYTFAGWNTEADGSGTPYEDGKSVKNLTDTADDTVTLFAQWSPIDVTVYFNANGGTGTMDKQVTKYDVKTTLNENKFTRDGYNFNGWNTKKDGTGTKVSDKAEVKVKSDTTLYAQWTEDVPVVYVSVSFDANGGEGSMTSQSFVKGSEVTLNDNQFKRTGYTFKGWNTEKNGSGTSYANKAKFSSDADAILYAQWEQDQVTIRFIANGGTGSMDSIKVNVNEEFELPACTFVRSGYTFKGWSTAANGSSTVIANKAKVKATKNTNLYAQWQKNTTTAKTSTSNTDALKQGSLAKTNDPTNMGAMAAVAVVGAALIAGGVFYSKKKQKND